MEVIKVDVSIEAVSFWHAIKLYYEQPKCINKQVLFSESVVIAELPTFPSVTECNILVDNLTLKLREGKNLKIDTEIQKDLGFRIISEKDVNEVFECHTGVYLLCRKLIPKLSLYENLKFYEFIFLDKSLLAVYILTKSLSYNLCKGDPSIGENKSDSFVILKYDCIQLHWFSEYLEVSYKSDLSEKGITWLKATFIPKFTKLSTASNYEKTNKKLSTLQFNNDVDVVEFYKLYEEMKAKYGKYFVEHFDGSLGKRLLLLSCCTTKLNTLTKMNLILTTVKLTIDSQTLQNWTENTDPKKFVYEDIAIATYLLILWSKRKNAPEGSMKQKFLDMGCGNGLLVHILNSEGHLGVGLDIRKRKIWDVYPPSTVLKEQTIMPSTQTTYPDADWLIGNHSDELTAWIPIMARLSNSHCQYFVLPCCPYQLNGMKFQRKNTSLSSYQDFIGYLKQVSEICGFITHIDKLRIPSTKRICLIGLSNPEMSKHKYSLLVETVVGFAEQEIQCSQSGNVENYSNTGHEYSANVKIRKPVEAVRNCTQLSQGLIDNVLKQVMHELLKENNTLMVNKEGEQLPWNRGGQLSIKELASCLEEQLMKQLKKECKGLQTLLKNQHFIFEVSQGQVQFRKPDDLLKISKKILNSQNISKWKMKKCWFFNNHPDRCPLANEICSYSHEV